MPQITCKITDASGHGVYGVMADLTRKDPRTHIVERFESDSDCDGVIDEWHQPIKDDWWTQVPVQIPASAFTISFSYGGLPSQKVKFHSVEAEVTVNEDERVHFTLLLDKSISILNYTRCSRQSVSDTLRPQGADVEMMDISPSQIALDWETVVAQLVPKKRLQSDGEQVCCDEPRPKKPKLEASSTQSVINVVREPQPMLTCGKRKRGTVPFIVNKGIKTEEPPKSRSEDPGRKILEE